MHMHDLATWCCHSNYAAHARTQIGGLPAHHACMYAGMAHQRTSFMYRMVSHCVLKCTLRVCVRYSQALGMSRFFLHLIDGVVERHGMDRWIQMLETEFGGMNDVSAPTGPSACMHPPTA